MYFYFTISLLSNFKVFNTLGEVLKISRMFSEVVSMNVDKWTEREQNRSEELGKVFDLSDFP